MHHHDPCLRVGAQAYQWTMIFLLLLLAFFSFLGPRIFLLDNIDGIQEDRPLEILHNSFWVSMAIFPHFCCIDKSQYYGSCCDPEVHVEFM